MTENKNYDFVHYNYEMEIQNDAKLHWNYDLKIWNWQKKNPVIIMRKGWNYDMIKIMI